MSLINHYCAMLDTIGDGSGSTNCAANFSGALTKFTIKNLNGKSIEVGLFNILLADDANFLQDKYAGLNALTNGISVKYKRAGVIYDLLQGAKIKKTIDWIGHQTSRGETYLMQDASHMTMKFQFAFDRAFAQPIALQNLNDEFYVELNDDFSALIAHQFSVSGMRET